MMNAARWKEITRIYGAVVARPAAERADAVAALCGDDPELRLEVESLLDESGQGANVLDRAPFTAGAILNELHLTPGTTIGPYRVVDLLGVGGMGEVYRARDTKLNRDVAIKILPAAVANDPDRLARFKREAQVLASLNHPNIGGIYGFEDTGSVHALVLELVEGPTLADMLASGSGSQASDRDRITPALVDREPGPKPDARRPKPAAISLSDSLAIAHQIANALEAAHEQGVIHRDLKPANIKVRADGTVKVLDFGLAKITDPGVVAGRQAGVTNSPTITTPAMTAAGLILGTAAYMSPEQAKGKPADKRSDIWSFGCVIYEMLTGTRPFAGDDVAEVLAAVLAREPDWTRLPVALPNTLAVYLKRCLYKDPKQRVGDIQDLRLALDGAFETATVEAAGSAASVKPRTAVTAASLLAGAIIAALLFWLGRRAPDVNQAHLAKLEIVAAGAAALSTIDDAQHLILTPDGLHLVYLGNRGTQLFVRSLNQLEPMVVFNGSVRSPFVSPDSQWIGFNGDGQLKKMAITGGSAIAITPIDAPTARGAAWGPDDTIVFATSNGSTGLQRVSASGGAATVLTRPNVEQGEADHLFPEWLPGGRAVLFTITAARGGTDASKIAVLDPQTGKYTVVVEGGSHARYVSAHPDSSDHAAYLIYAAAGSLRAVQFDLSGLQIRGPSIAVVPDVATTSAGAVDVSVAGGTLVYLTGGVIADQARTLVWVDRQGIETAIALPAHPYVHPRLSRDGRRIAVNTIAGELDLFLSEVSRPALTRFTSGAGVDSFPVWSFDDKRVIYSSQRNSAGNLYSQATDGSRDVSRLTDSPNLQAPSGVSPDGGSLIFTEAGDVMQISLDGTGQVTPLVRTPFIERNGTLSPEGRWLAYEANDSGPFEVYVRPFPDVNSGVHPVSLDGGSRPLWSPKGNELFYVSRDGSLMRVGVVPGTSWETTAATVVVKAGYFTSPGNFGRTYDVSRDAQRFLMIKPQDDDSAAARRHLVVVLNWVNELKSLLPLR